VNICSKNSNIYEWFSSKEKKNKNKKLAT